MHAPWTHTCVLRAACVSRVACGAHKRNAQPTDLDFFAGMTIRVRSGTLGIHRLMYRSVVYHQVSDDE